jgi:peroxiredoxin Q/BCP
MSSLFSLLFPWLARGELLKVGDLAPEFSTNAVIGGQVFPVKLSDYHGRKVVLYFYPKDNTPGCTREACAFRDGYRRFQEWGVVLLGCSIDSADSHRGFIQKYRLPFPLLADPDKKIAKAYGVENGIPILGLDRRVTYVIDEDGKIIKIYPDVDPSAHAVEIIQDLGLVQAPPSPTPLANPSIAASSERRSAVSAPMEKSEDKIE